MLRLLNQPWFTSAKGNYEAMASRAFETNDGNVQFASSGDWFFGLDDSRQQEVIGLLLRFHHLPHIIEITNNTIGYVIVHADCPGKEHQFGEEITESESPWSIDHVQKSLSSELQETNDADFFIFDHMMSDNIQTFTSQIYMDTGLSKNGRLSFYKIKQSHASSMRHE